jgi:hypothetical protein
MAPLHCPQALNAIEHSVSKRQFLDQLAATSLAAIVWLRGAYAVVELWKSGDPLCVVSDRGQITFRTSTWPRGSLWER